MTLLTKMEMGKVFVMGVLVKIMAWISWQKVGTVCLAGTMAIAPVALHSKRQSVQANPLTATSDYPLELTLAELDGSWRQFRIAGQYEFADLMQTWFSLFGISNIYSNSYFTQGKTIEMGDQEYLVAYRFPLKPEALNLEDMFAVWDSGQKCDDMSQLEAAILTGETKVSLALLNPNTIGSLNDIQSLNVAGLIQASQEEFAMMQETCAEVEQENKIDEAVANLGSINRAQQTFWFENERFTDNFESLQVGFSAATETYNYTITLQNSTLATSQAIALTPEGHHIVGAIYTAEDNEDFPAMYTIVCEKSEPGGPVPQPPFFDRTTAYLACPLGTFETY